MLAGAKKFAGASRGPFTPAPASLGRNWLPIIQIKNLVICPNCLNLDRFPVVKDLCPKWWNLLLNWELGVIQFIDWWRHSFLCKLFGLKGRLLLSLILFFQSSVRHLFSPSFTRSSNSAIQRHSQITISMKHSRETLWEITTRLLFFFLLLCFPQTPKLKTTEANAWLFNLMIETNSIKISTAMQGDYTKTILCLRKSQNTAQWSIIVWN